MTNHHEATFPSSGGDRNRAWRQDSGTTFGLLMSVLAAIVLSLVVPQFRGALLAFGADLPWISHIVLDSHWVVWCLPATIIGVRFLWPHAQERGPISWMIGLVSALLVVLGLVALYLPIFKLAATM